MNEQEYLRAIGETSRDIGSVKLLRAFVNELLKEKGYENLRGYKSMKQLIAIKLKMMGVTKSDAIHSWENQLFKPRVITEV